jgi:hypothetical protein
MRLICVVVVCAGALPAQPALARREQTVAPETTERLDRLRALPRGLHGSEIRVDRTASPDVTRVWILSNEDDLRLYAPHGGQMEMDMQVWSDVRADAAPSFVTILIESRGGTTPADGSPQTAFLADGVPIAVTERAGRPARSGDLLFLSTEVRVPFPDFLRMATATAVDGRVWGLPFRLIDRQLEILRAYALRVVDEVRSGAERSGGAGPEQRNGPTRQ